MRRRKFVWNWGELTLPQIEFAAFEATAQKFKIERTLNKGKYEKPVAHPLRFIFPCLRDKDLIYSQKLNLSGIDNKNVHGVVFRTCEKWGDLS